MITTPSSVWTPATLFPTTTGRDYNRASIHAEKGDLWRAVEDLNRAIELDPGSAQTLYQRGMTYGSLGSCD